MTMSLSTSGKYCNMNHMNHIVIDMLHDLAPTKTGKNFAKKVVAVSVVE